MGQRDEETSGVQPTIDELLQMPPSLEALSAKLDHMIVRFEVGIKHTDRVGDEANAAKVASERSAMASQRAADAALRLVAQRPAVSRTALYAVVLACAVSLMTAFTALGCVLLRP